MQGFEAQCAASAACPDFAATFRRYAAAHALATEGASPPEGMAHARLLVVSDHWRNVGMGFMPTHVASTLVLAMAANIYVYFDNYGRYDWARYFYGHHGLDLRWTPARRRMWAARFAALGVTKHVVRVLVEEGPQVYLLWLYSLWLYVLTMPELTMPELTMPELTLYTFATHYSPLTMAILATQHGSGEEEWEPHLSAALGNHSECAAGYTSRLGLGSLAIGC